MRRAISLRHDDFSVYDPFFGPFSALAKRAQSKIYQLLTNGLGSYIQPLFAQLTDLASPLEGTFPGYTKDLIGGIEENLPSVTKMIMHGFDKCEVTFLWPKGGSLRTPEMILSCDFLEEANKTESVRWTGAGFTFSQAAQIKPINGDVPFK